MRISTRLRLYLWLALALAVVLMVVTWLWLRGTWLDGAYSPLPPPLFGESPLPTPVSGAVLPSGGGFALLWVALGMVLALLVALIIVYWSRRA